MWLTAPHGRSHLTFHYNGFLPENCDFPNLGFSTQFANPHRRPRPAPARQKNLFCGAAPFISCACPGSIRKRTRFPSTSTEASICVVSPAFVHLRNWLFQCSKAGGKSRTAVECVCAKRCHEKFRSRLFTTLNLPPLMATHSQFKTPMRRHSSTN